MIQLLRSRVRLFDALLLTLILLSVVGLYYRGAITEGFRAPGSPFSTPKLDDQKAPAAHDDDVRPSNMTTHDDECAWLPPDFSILTVMKTGASESFHKVPTQLLTVLKCIPKFYIFSDMKQRIAGIDVYDSLDTVLPEAMDGNKDFDIYRRQKQCVLDQDACNKGHDFASQGWNLDKYKNIHISERSYHMAPNYDWYFTIDADTYVVWRNLLAWLRTLDPNKKHYLGHTWWFAGIPFGYGGSGYLLSKGAMSKFVGDHPGIANQYDVETKTWEGGDFMLGKAVKETISLAVKDVWPILNPSKPSLMGFAEKLWCHPIATLHHMNSEEVDAFYDFEQRFWAAQKEAGTFRPLLAKDIYADFLVPRLREKREDWDNQSEGRYYLDPNAKKYEQWQLDRQKKGAHSAVEKEAHKSFDHCRKMCYEVEDCLQFRFQDGICAAHWEFSLGKPMKKEEDEAKRWMSGWAVEKIHKWADAHQKCDKIDWPPV